jgi:hypothetical protein
MEKSLFVSEEAPTCSAGFVRRGENWGIRKSSGSSGNEAVTREKLALRIIEMMQGGERAGDT